MKKLFLAVNIIFTLSVFHNLSNAITLSPTLSPEEKRYILETHGIILDNPSNVFIKICFCEKDAGNFKAEKLVLKIINIQNGDVIIEQELLKNMAPYKCLEEMKTNPQCLN